MTLADPTAHRGHLLGMSPAHTNPVVKRARAGGDPAAITQPGKPMTTYIAHLEPVFVFDGPPGEKKWAIMTISRE